MAKALFGVIAFVGVLVVGFAFIPCENYNYIYPSIDTRYAPRYSEDAFSLVTLGISVQSVERMLGPPLYTQTSKNGRLEWYYTLDGKCSWGDFAWLVRAVHFTNDHVSEIVKRISYD